MSLYLIQYKGRKMTNELDYLERIAVAVERIADAMGSKKFNLPPLDDGKLDNYKNVDSIIGDMELIKHTDAWVLVPYDVCITTFPAQYSTTIYHYHDPNGLNVDAMNRGNNTKIFFTKDEAVDYCKTSLGCEYQIVDIPYAEKIVIGDDYE